MSSDDNATTFDSSRLQKYIHLAWNIAGESMMSHRHGAVLFKNGQPIPLAVECNKGDRTIFRGDPVPGMHAEVACLQILYNMLRRSKQKRSVHYDIMVVKRSCTSENPFGPSKPCAICLYYMKKFGIRRVYYYSTEKKWCVKTVDQLIDEPEKHISFGAQKGGLENFKCCSINIQPIKKKVLV